MNLAISLRSEVLKTKRTAAFYFTLIGAAIVPFMFFLNALTEGLPDEDKSVKDPLNAIFKIASEMNGLGIFPLFIVLICTLLPQIEHKNNTWKQVLTSPSTKANTYAAKFFNIHLLIILFLVASHVFMWIVAIAIHFILPELSLLNQSLNAGPILVTNLNSYASLLAVSTIQFWLGLRFKNFIGPVAIGVVLWLVGTVLVFEYHSKLAHYFPYSFHTSPFVSSSTAELSQVLWKSAGYAAVVLTLGFLDFRRRRMIG